MRCEQPGVIRLAMQGAVLVALAACSTVDRVWPVVRHPGSVLKRTSDDSNGGTQASAGVTKADSDAVNAAYKAAREECKSSLATPELDPIRHKVELLRENDEEPLPFEIATNDTFPTAEERPVIAKWATLRDACNRRWADVPLPASANQMQTTVLKQMRAFGQQVTDDDTELIIGLYQQKLTYGEFGRKRYEIARASRAFKLAFSQAVAGSNNTQRQLEDLQAAQQQFTDTIDAFSKYVRAVQARKPRSVHMDGSKQVPR